MLRTNPPQWAGQLFGSVSGYFPGACGLGLGGGGGFGVVGFPYGGRLTWSPPAVTTLGAKTIAIDTASRVLIKKRTLILLHPHMLIQAIPV